MSWMGSVQTMLMVIPQSMAAMAPARVSPLQNRLKIKTGQKVAVMPVQAKRTRLKTTPSGSRARAKARPHTAAVTQRARRRAWSSLMLTPSVLCQTSRTTADETKIRRESAVLMIAAKTMATSTPVRISGKRRLER